MARVAGCLAVTLVLMLFCTSEAHLHFGVCPVLPTVQNLSLTRIEGTWYEVQSIGFFLESLTTRCNKVEFSNRTTEAINVAYTRNFWPGRVSVTTGYAQLVEDGQFTMSLDLTGFGRQSFPYWILETDYSNYAITWSCTQFPFLNIQKVWILSRNRNLDYKTTQKVNDFLRFNGIEVNQLKKINQVNCDS